MAKILFLLFGIVLIVGATVSQSPQQRTGNVQSEDEVRITVLQGDVDGYPLFVSINSSLWEYSRKPELPWFVSSSTNFIHPTKNGLPKQEVFAALNSWEDSIEASLGKNCRYAHLGHVTSKGSRRVLFYVDNRDSAEAALRKLKLEGKTLTFDFKVDRDDNWESVATYFKANSSRTVN